VILRRNGGEVGRGRTGAFDPGGCLGGPETAGVAGGAPAEYVPQAPADVGGVKLQPGAAQNERGVGGVNDVEGGRWSRVRALQASMTQQRGSGMLER